MKNPEAPVDPEYPFYEEDDFDAKLRKERRALASGELSDELADSEGDLLVEDRVSRQVEIDPKKGYESLNSGWKAFNKGMEDAREDSGEQADELHKE